VIAPTQLAGRWLICYSGGATVSADEKSFEKFKPTPREIAEFEARFPHFADQGKAWPDQYSA
jgi:hypothetical protein